MVKRKVLDINILTWWRYRKSGVLAAIADQLRLKLLPALTAIKVHEALYGFENKAAKVGTLDDRIKRDRLAIEQLINSCVVLPFDQRAAEIAAYIIPRLPKNIPKPTLLDALISGHGTVMELRQMIGGSSLSGNARPMD